MSTDCKYRAMCTVNNIVCNTCQKYLLHSTHTCSTDYYNIHIIFPSIINYCLSDSVRFLDNFLFYINSFFLCLKINFVE